jgi:hypothetical protein
MAEKMVLIRVGVDTGCRPVHANGPLLPDGSFELIPIPDHVSAAFTYGSPARIQSRLATLQAGDLLIFYGGLRPVSADCRPLPAAVPTCYLFGYFELACALRAQDHEREELLPRFGANIHVRHADVFARQQETLVLAKGGPGSRLLARAVPISEPGRDRGGRRLQVLAAPLRAVFGPLGGLGSIQRCTPRWIAPEHVERAAAFIRSLPS